MKYPIGAVCFGVPSGLNAAGYEYISIMGQRRVNLLQLVLDEKPLPDGLFLLAYDGGGFSKIGPDEINWETSGLERSKA